MKNFEPAASSGFMRLRNITEKGRILRNRNAAANTLRDHYGCNINTRNIGRLLWISIPLHPTTVKVRYYTF